MDGAITSTCCFRGVDMSLLQKKKQPFAVVAFVAGDDDDDETVEAVPASWLTPSKKHCYWPPYTKPNQVMRAITSQLVPGTSWKLHASRCLKLCSKYITQLLTVCVICSFIKLNFAFTTLILFGSRKGIQPVGKNYVVKRN